MEKKSTFLSEINRRFIDAICGELGIRTKITSSTDYSVRGDDATERLASLCEQSGARVYLSGPAAKAYMQAAPFDRLGVRVEYFDYADYPEYRQLFPPFVHTVSILDLLLNEGPEARRFLKTTSRAAEEQ